MSGLDSNPFADPHAPSPFADPAVTQVTSRSQQAQSGLGLEDYNPFAEPAQPRPPSTTTSPPQYRPASTAAAPAATVQPAVMQAVTEPPPAYTAGGGGQSTTITTAELQKRQEELERKAAELQAREEALRGAAFNARANNWPPLPEKCCVAPCFYQDIGVDIPLEFQKIVRTVYYLWIFYVLVLVLNFLGGLAILVKMGGATHFGFSILYMVLFAPLSFLCWFRPLYKAFRSDSSFNFMVFFFVFFVQLIVSVIYAVGIGTTGASGFVVAIDAVQQVHRARHLPHARGDGPRGQRGLVGHHAAARAPPVPLHGRLVRQGSAGVHGGRTAQRTRSGRRRERGRRSGPYGRPAEPRQPVLKEPHLH
ncbi:hypothetical protein HPB50_009338 [Hyalomma asiaticum]|uniref:Uncharacterized protein n=1 Tax=Hyalomma asiaticum TaxID=266040 RepID=A0ACB7T461_HYAAI|nr:hypothetical protein HPB50_009338 [Hyalomma asiaticum]